MFVLSAGHGSMFLYSWLHLSGYKISIEDIKNFRQLGSNTPGKYLFLFLSVTLLLAFWLQYIG